MHAQWENGVWIRTAVGVWGVIAMVGVMAQSLPVFADEPVAAQGAMTGDGGMAPAQKPTRRTLLREGSLLMHAVGRISNDMERGAWVFTPTQHSGSAGGGAAMVQQSSERVMEAIDNSNLGSAQLVLLPNSVLSEVARMTDSASGEALTFEVTGEVYVYRQRNYLLAVSAPRLMSSAGPTQPAPSTDKPAMTNGGESQTMNPTAQATQPNGEAMPGESVEDIKKQLDAAVGAVPIRAGAGKDARDGEDMGIATEGGGRVQREGTTVLSRRGRLARDSQGAWVFVFDADGQGLADPPLILMPCLLLERLENYAGRLGNDARILISGHVTTYGSKNYLLPTAFTIPNERTKISQ